MPNSRPMLPSGAAGPRPTGPSAYAGMYLYICIDAVRRRLCPCASLVLSLVPVFIFGGMGGTVVCLRASLLLQAVADVRWPLFLLHHTGGSTPSIAYQGHPPAPAPAAASGYSSGYGSSGFGSSAPGSTAGGYPAGAMGSYSGGYGDASGGARVVALTVALFIFLLLVSVSWYLWQSLTPLP
jgi:hypothetical protein